jgi:hypothetical protein
MGEIGLGQAAGVVETPVTGVDSDATGWKEPEVVPELFPEVAQVRFCSENVCTAGHAWTPVMAVGQCPGCKAPVLAVQMTQCPFCNEPVARIRYRQDHVPRGAGIVPMCKPGALSAGEVTEVAMERGRWREVERGDIEKGAGVING